MLSDYTADAADTCLCDEGREKRRRTTIEGKDSLWVDLNDDDATTVDCGDDLLFRRLLRRRVVGSDEPTTSRLSLGGGLRWPLAGGREEEGVHRARTRSSSSLPRHRQAWILLLLDLVVAARECAMGLRVERPQRNHGESMSSPFPFTEH